MLTKYLPKNQAQLALRTAWQAAAKAMGKRASHRGKWMARSQVRASACRRRAWRVGELWNEEEAEFFRPYAEQLLR